MDANISNQQYLDSGSSLDEPHFDEEATLLSAQPVVPLQEIRAEKRSRRRLLFGLAIACSLAMGALSATLLYKQPSLESSTAVSQVAPGAAGITLETPVAAITYGVEGAATGTSPQPETHALPVPRKPSPSVTQSAAAVETKRKTLTPVQIQAADQTWDERFYERRLRRVSEREALRASRRRQRRSSDDLMRIREIFEGPSKP